MHKRIAIGLIVLIFVIGVVSVFVLLQPAPEIEKVSDIDPVEIEHGVTSQPTFPAREGYKMVKHGDHYHEVPISETGQFNDTLVSNPIAKPVPFSNDASEGMTMQARVAASDDVPKYAELKKLTDEALQKVHDKADEEAMRLSPEVDRLNDKYLQAEVNLTQKAKTPAEYDNILAVHSDTLIPLREAYYGVLQQYFIHNAIADKSRDVILWRISEKNKKSIIKSGYPAVIVNLREPFD